MAKYEEFITKIIQRKQATQLVREKIQEDRTDYTKTAVDTVDKLLDTLLLIAQQGGLSASNITNYLAWGTGPVADLVKYLDTLEKNEIANTKWSVIIHDDITYQLAASYLAFLYYLGRDPEPQDMLGLLDPGSKKILFTDVPKRLKQTLSTHFLTQTAAHQFNEALFDMLPDELQDELRVNYEQKPIIIAAKNQLETFQRSLQEKIPVPAEPPAEPLIQNGNQLSITLLIPGHPVLETKQRHYSAAQTALNDYKVALIAKRALLPQNIAACRAENPIPEDAAAYPKPFHTAVDTLYAQIEAKDQDITQQLSQIETLLAQVDRELQEINRLREEQDPARLSNQIIAAQERLKTASTIQPTTLASSYVEDPVKQALLDDYVESSAKRKAYLEEAIPVLQSFQSILETDDIEALTRWEAETQKTTGYFLDGEQKLADSIDGFLDDLKQQAIAKSYIFPLVRNAYETLAHPLQTTGTLAKRAGMAVGFVTSKETIINYLQEKISKFQDEKRIDITTVRDATDWSSWHTKTRRLQFAYQAEVDRPAIEREQVGFLDEYSQSISRIEYLQAQLSLTVLQRMRHLGDFDTCSATLDTLLQDSGSEITALENEQSTARMNSALLNARTLGASISTQVAALETENQKAFDIHYKLRNACPARYQVQHEAFHTRHLKLIEELRTVKRDQNQFAQKHQALLDTLISGQAELEQKKLDQLALACDKCIQDNSLPTDGVPVPIAEKPIRLQAIKAQQAILENPNGFFVKDQFLYGQATAYTKLVDKKSKLNAVAEALDSAITSDQQKFKDKRAQLKADFFTDGSGFKKYLAERNATLYIAILDWFEFITIGFFGLFWEQTEYGKRNNYVHKLEAVTEQYVKDPTSNGELHSLLKQGKQKGLFTNQYFAPRCPKDQPDYDKTLQHQLEKFEAELNITEALNTEPAITTYTY